MVAIGDFELVVMKAMKLAGGSVLRTSLDSLALEATAEATLEALDKLERAEYVASAPDHFSLTELADEYLSILGLD